MGTLSTILGSVEEQTLAILNDSSAADIISPSILTSGTSTDHTDLVSPESQTYINGVALFVLPVLCLIGLIGNFLVCIAIATDRRLHNVTNYFLFSLALADLLVCCIVMPLSIVVEVRQGKWNWSVSMCLMYVYSDVFLCSASIVHMSVISLDRYLGISKPLRTRNKSKTLIFVKIFFVWMITMIVSCPIALLAATDNTYILQDNQCMIFSRYYILYGSTMTFVIPLIIMSGTYVRTTTLLKNQASLLSQKSGGNMNGNGLRRTMPHRKLGYVRTNSATVNGTYANGKQILIDGRSTYSAYDPNNRLGTNRPPINLLNGHKTLEKASTINRWRSRTSNYISNIASKVGRRSSLQAASQDLANEHKATRVLAVVFLCFFICWTPFFVANFYMGFCGHGCVLPPSLGSLALWLGYISSTINPIIYTVFNIRFRQSFVRILRCQCFHPLRDSHTMYSRNYTTTIVPDTYTWSNHERATSILCRAESRSARSCERPEISRGARSDVIEDNSVKKTSLPTYASCNDHLRDSRATTEDTVTTSTDEENRPLLTKVVVYPSTVRKSLTSIMALPINVQLAKSLATSLTSQPGPTRSHSCVDCKRADVMMCSDMADMTSSSISTSSASCPKHLTLFTQIDETIKETFL